jgi:glycosyltransferase involved in cell wall biosynthesis
MLVTCITITQVSRAALLADAVRDFLRQTYAERELLILHDGDAAAHRALQDLLQRLGVEGGTSPVRLQRASAPAPLGQLRRGLALSRGELICQWDDDDRYHPERLALQCGALRERGPTSVSWPTSSTGSRMRAA